MKQRRTEYTLLGPYNFFAKILVAIFFVETILMLLMRHQLSFVSDSAKVYLDGLLLMLFLAPLIYYLVVRPLLQKNEEYKRWHLELEQVASTAHDRQSFIESVLEGIQSGIMVTDQELRINLVNKYTTDFFGKVEAELVGTDLKAICPRMYELVNSGTDANEVAETLPSFRKVGFKRFDLRRSDGFLAGHIISFIDISEMEKVRKEMRQKERLATMGEVVARVAHEMRNPLFGITASAQILAMELPLAAEQKELMSSILSEAKRMTNMVDELLDCSKEMQLNKTPFDIGRAVSDCISSNQPFILEKKISIQRALPESECLVKADPERVRQVLLNLVKNAIDSAPVGGSIRVEVEAGKKAVITRVWDSGAGIPTDSLEKIFDVFYTTKRSGTGLGLAVSRKIMEAHGGTIVAENSLAGGAIFTMTLPLEDT